MTTWVIAMVIQMSGGRYDDRQWPGPGIPFEVPDWEGAGLVADHNAVKLYEIPDGEPVPPAVEEPAAAEPVPSWEDEHDRLEAVADGTVEPQAEPPRPADPKQAWIDYAVTQGASVDEATSMTKIDLMSRYGGRL